MNTLQFEKPTNWNTIVQTANTLESYNVIVASTSMFSDNIFNSGRLHVLRAFTKDVCLAFPEISFDVIISYLKFMSQTWKK